MGLGALHHLCVLHLDRATLLGQLQLLAAAASGSCIARHLDRGCVSGQAIPFHALQSGQGRLVVEPVSPDAHLGVLHPGPATASGSFRHLDGGCVPKEARSHSMPSTLIRAGLSQGL